ncbi:MAG TPA: hypothetical protein VER33_28780 [Polyangiaceae bacterium]|nr:hypothetical protein [Polyangiaceae bacterium]
MGKVNGRVALTVGVSLWSAEAFAQAPPSAAFPSDSATSPPAAAPSAPVSPATGSEAPATQSSAPEPAPPPTPPAGTAPAAASEPSAARVRAAPEPERSHEAEEAPAGKDQSRFLSLTMSPLHLLSPIFEAHLELKPVPHLGVKLIGGVGSAALESSDASIDGTRFAAYELGLQAVGYPLSEFDSLHLGAELLYVHVSTEEIDGREVSADGTGLAIGPFIGYKLITRGGFTFVAQGGFQYITAKGQASDSAGNNAEAEDASVIALLNLDIGWSF